MTNSGETRIAQWQQRRNSTTQENVHMSTRNSWHTPPRNCCQVISKTDKNFEPKNEEHKRYTQFRFPYVGANLPVNCNSYHVALNRYISPLNYAQFMYGSFIFTALHLHNNSLYNAMFIRENISNASQGPLGANQTALCNNHNVAHCKVALLVEPLWTSNDSSQIVSRKPLPISIDQILHMAPTSSDVAVVFVSTYWRETDAFVDSKKMVWR